MYAGKITIFIFTLLALLTASIACSAAEEQMIYAYIGDQVLTIKPENNSSAQAFIELLSDGDITIEMHDYGNFEKVGSIGANLPRNDEPITTEPGDVILYLGTEITIYYDINSWNFTRLGKVQDMTQSELKQILGSGNVTVRFSLTKSQDGTVGEFDFETHTVVLNSGYEMPIIGLGTWTLTNDSAENSVYHALKTGMRLIDTARYYGCEAPLWGLGMSNVSFRCGFCPGGARRIERLIRMIQAGRVHPGKLLNYKFEGFEKIEDAFKVMDSKPRDLIKPYVLI